MPVHGVVGLLHHSLVRLVRLLGLVDGLRLPLLGLPKRVLPSPLLSLLVGIAIGLLERLGLVMSLVVCG